MICGGRFERSLEIKGGRSVCLCLLLERRGRLQGQLEWHRGAARRQRNVEALHTLGSKEMAVEREEARGQQNSQGVGTYLRV